MTDRDEEEQRGAQSRASAALPREKNHPGECLTSPGLDYCQLYFEGVQCKLPIGTYLEDEEWKKLDDTLGGVVPSDASELKTKYLALLDEWERLKLVELELKSKTHVVVTRASRGDGAVKVVHAYGPFTKTKARFERNAILNDLEKSGTDGNEVLVSVCRMIDIDAMNAADKKPVPQGWPYTVELITPGLTPKSDPGNVRGTD